jgi:hypothetical protein
LITAYPFYVLSKYSEIYLNTKLTGLNVLSVLSDNLPTNICEGWLGALRIVRSNRPYLGLFGSAVVVTQLCVCVFLSEVLCRLKLCRRGRNKLHVSKQIHIIINKCG